MSIPLRSGPLSVSLHGGQTRNMITIEIGRKTVDRMTAEDGNEVLRLVEKWLRDGGVESDLLSKNGESNERNQS